MFEPDLNRWQKQWLNRPWEVRRAAAGPRRRAGRRTRAGRAVVLSRDGVPLAGVAQTHFILTVRQDEAISRPLTGLL
jgi:hypothetical protein